MGSTMAGSSSRNRSSKQSDTSTRNMEDRLKILKRGEHADMSSEDQVRLHSRHCDKLYRWSMWRMYINEQLSRSITENNESDDRQVAPISGVISPYLDHPDCPKYGRLMRRMFGPEGNFETVPRCLSDSHYLVYGIPRISVTNKVPDSVSQLYGSCDIYDEQNRRGVNAGDMGSNESDQITELFSFVGSASTTSSQDSVFGDKSQVPEHSKRDETFIKTNTKAVNKADDTTKPRAYEQAIPPPPPPPPTHYEYQKLKRGTVAQVEAERLVSRSRMYWERLAVKKEEIIRIGKQPNQKKTPTNPMISSDMLLKQHTMLKSQPKKKSSKDHWRSLADRKHEILRMGEQMPRDNDNEREAGHGKGGRHQEGKASQLWNFMFSRKRELLDMKEGKHKADHTPRLESDREGYTSSMNLNVENNFQQELAEKLRRRRNNVRPSYSEY